MGVATQANVSYFYFGLYIATGFVIMFVTIMLFYVACSKRYRLNWYEKNLLERRIETRSVVTNSETSSLQSLYPSVEDICQTTSQAGFVVATTNVPVSVTEELLPNVRLANYSYPKPTLSDSSSSPQTDLDKTGLIFNSPTKSRQVSMQTKLDPSKINTSLYQQAVFIQSPTESKGAGIVHLFLSYDIAAGILNVRIIEVNDLRATELNGTANPYAKLRLLPHHANVWQTRVQKRTLNPVFDEDFVFEVDPQEVGRHTLEVTLCDFIAYARHRNIGTIRLQLAHVDLSQATTVWKELKPCSERDLKAELGDLMVSLAYLPSAERLTVTVIKARNLKIVDETRTSSDPFVKVGIIVDGKRIKKQKTSLHRNTISPVFNEALMFKLNRETFKRCSIEFRVFHDSLLGGSELLGICILGSDPACRFHDRQMHSQLMHDQLLPAQWLPLTDAYSY